MTRLWASGTGTQVRRTLLALTRCQVYPTMRTVGYRAAPDTPIVCLREGLCSSPRD
jgi:hypothetical protein